MKRLFDFSFDPHKSFLLLPVLWWVVGSILCIAFLSTLIIIAGSQLYWRFDYIGFNQAISFFKVPLGITALIIPVVALLASNHRSVQTKHQIELTSSQNNFSNYYNHINEFTKYIDEHISNEFIKFNRIISLHRLLFPAAKHGVFDMNKSVYVRLNKDMKNLFKLINKFKVGHDGEPYQTLIAIHLIHKRLCESFNIKFPPDVSVTTIDLDGVSVYSSSVYLKGFFATTLLIASAINEIIAFDDAHVIKDALDKVLTLKLGNVPEFDFVHHLVSMNIINFDPFD